jgi:hypothetical protein
VTNAASRDGVAALDFLVVWSAQMKMGLSGIVGFGAVLALASAMAADAPADWHQYDYPDFAFSIDFPAKPTRTDKTLTQSGTVSSANIGAALGSEAFSVTTADFTHRAGGPPADADHAAQEGMEGVFSVGAMHGLRKFAVPGGSGLEGIAITDHETMRARLYYIAPYTWVLFASTTNRNDYPALYRGDAKHFFDSFRPHVK